VRRDWCTLSREAGSIVLDIILSGAEAEVVVSKIHEYLRDVAVKVAANELGIEQYIITKALTKAPHDYPDAKSQPHVLVAKAMLEQGVSVAPGQVIEYVVCVDAGKASVAERSYHPRTVLKAEGMLQVDTAWYLAQQIHPPIWRLCEPIEGIDSQQVAECLGLDSTKFQAYSVPVDAGARDELLPTTNELARFADAKPLSVRCSSCKTSADFRGLMNHGAPGGSAISAGEWIGSKALDCAYCGVRYDEPRLRNALTMSVRAELAAYYSSPLQCEETSCKEQSRGLSTHVARDDAGMPLFPVCTVPRCKGRMLKIYGEKRLHNQLLFYKSLFDVRWAHDKIDADNKRRCEKVAADELAPVELNAFRDLAHQAEAVLCRSAYHVIDFPKLLGNALSN